MVLKGKSSGKLSKEIEAVEETAEGIQDDVDIAIATVFFGMLILFAAYTIFIKNKLINIRYFCNNKTFSCYKPLLFLINIYNEDYKF